MIKKKITAVLGPTNTGKTHLAIETMLSFENGMIGKLAQELSEELDIEAMLLGMDGLTFDNPKDEYDFDMAMNGIEVY